MLDRKPRSHSENEGFVETQKDARRARNVLFASSMFSIERRNSIENSIAYMFSIHPKVQLNPWPPIHDLTRRALIWRSINGHYPITSEYPFSRSQILALGALETSHCCLDRLFRHLGICTRPFDCSGDSFAPPLRWLNGRATPVRIRYARPPQTCLAFRWPSIR